MKNKVRCLWTVPSLDPGQITVQSLNMANHEHIREIEELRAKLEKLTAQHGFGLQRFAGSDEDIRFYTRFANYTHLMAFWYMIERAAETKFIRVTSTNPSETSVT